MANLTKGIDNVGLIVDQNESLHNYYLKPKKTKTIHNSKMIIIIDRNFETFLTKTLLNLNKKKTKIIEVAKIAGIKLNEDENGDHHHHGEEDHDHYTELYDYHIWLDPTMVKVVAQGLADIFIEENPSKAAQYKHNLNDFIMRLDELDKNIKLKMDKTEKANFIVVHNAYQYFINRYGLEQPKVITIDHDHNIGAREFLSIQKSIREDKVKCIFEEPQFDSKIIAKIKGNSNVKISKLDAEWGPDNIKIEDQYIAMMNELTDSFYNCLGH